MVNLTNHQRNANQNHDEILSDAVEWLYKKMKSVGKNMKKREYLYT
jgi:hypothetical protein